MNRSIIFASTLVCIFFIIAGCKKDSGGCETAEYIPVKIADTGQVMCSSGPDGNEAMVNCDSVAVSGQDGNYTDIPKARRFSGPTQHGTYSDDHTTEDNVTKLVWKTCTEGMEYNGANCTGTAETMTWHDATDTCCALNSANSGSGYAGRTDWRLPSINELITIVDYGKSEPAIDETYFPNTQGAGLGETPYWASSEFRNKKSSYVLYFNNGTVLYWNKSDSVYVRCVSGQ
ncbi:DUF1566 domain-containing protein [Spirochaetota bacterium]